MDKLKHPAQLSQRLFNTLAQTETTQTKKEAVILNGNGSNLSTANDLKKKAKRKLITQTMMFSLIDLADKTGTKERKKSYWNTYHCQNRIFTVDGKIYGKYCKNRFCTLCCSIRKAVLINKYLPIVKTWEQPYFVTLTAKSVALKSLNKRMADMNRGFRKISSKYRKRAIRGTDIKLVGIKALECNFNPVTKKYNPHLHLLVVNEKMADILIKEWLCICTPKFALRPAQYKRKVDNEVKDLIEIVKYGSKIFTEPDINKKIYSKGNRTIYVAALDNIFKAMKGIRIFERFGFNLPSKPKEESNAFVVTNYEKWLFDINCFDWLNNKEEKLSNYKPEKN